MVFCVGAVLFSMIIAQTNPLPQQSNNAFATPASPVTTTTIDPLAAKCMGVNNTGVNCDDGVIFPLWRPVHDIGLGRWCLVVVKASRSANDIF